MKLRENFIRVSAQCHGLGVGGQGLAGRVLGGKLRSENGPVADADLVDGTRVLQDQQ